MGSIARKIAPSVGATPCGRPFAGREKTPTQACPYNRTNVLSPLGMGSIARFSTVAAWGGQDPGPVLRCAAGRNGPASPLHPRASPMAKNKKLLILAGDGIGPEVMRQVARVLDWFAKRRALSFEIQEGL